MPYVPKSDFCAWCGKLIIVRAERKQDLEPYVFRDGHMVHEKPCAEYWDREVEETVRHA